jgi:NADH:ubiquinone oxidoreductase subunit 2 (subunit N)
MLLGLVPGNSMGYFALFTYLIIYVITNFCFFTLLLICQHYFYTGGGTRLTFINQFKPYMQSSVFFFFLFLITLLSFAGIPPFAGFFAKFFVLYTLATNGFEITVLVLLLAILIGTFMYLRFIKIALFEPTSFFKAFLQTVSTASRVYDQQSYSLHPVVSHSLFYSTKISWSHERLLFGLIFGCSFLLGFVFFISVYFTLIFDLTLGFLSV